MKIRLQLSKIKPIPSSVMTEATQIATLTTEPIVRLENYFREPYNLAIATARTCYSPQVIFPDEVNRDDETRAQRDRIAESIYRAGHHTTIQHPTFQFVLERVSRQFIWSFLHSHPFYNSEQVSQRFVEVKPEHVTIPPLDESARQIYLDTVQCQMGAYHKLSKLVEPTVLQEYQRLFPVRNLEEKRWRSAVKKRCQEVARYCLPVATHAHLYHTISGITLHRYWRLCQQFDTPCEQRLVVGKMVEEVSKIDPQFMMLADGPMPLEETLEYRLFKEFHRPLADGSGKAFLDEFDQDLGGYSSKLVDYKLNCQETMAQAVRSVLGLPKDQLGDARAIDLVLNPARNPYLSDSLTLTTISKLTRTMVHPHFTFKKKLSHTADSQDQRHRMVPASRPVLARHFLANRPDYIVPALIKATPLAEEEYRNTMVRIWKGIEQLLDIGTRSEFALYLLPNAFPIRFEESGDLLHFHHKWIQRLCYTAQEEIWNACREEVLQVKALFPQIGQYLQAPCWLRAQAKISPYCPERDRFCGVGVWKIPIEQYRRLI